MEDFDKIFSFDDVEDDFAMESVFKFLMKKVDSAKKDSAMNVDVIQNRTKRGCCDTANGIELLFHQAVDFLGGPNSYASKILMGKMSQDYQVMEVINEQFKTFVFLGIAFMNIIFVSYALYIGARRSFEWQKAFVSGCVLQFVLEIGFISTMECLWVNYFIPSLISIQIRAAIWKMKESIFRLTNVLPYFCHILRLPYYVDISAHTARVFPNLLESFIVLAYESYMPNRDLSDSIKTLKGETSRMSLILRSLHINIVLPFAALPSIYNRLLVRLTMPGLAALLLIPFSITTELLIVYFVVILLLPFIFALSLYIFKIIKAWSRLKPNVMMERNQHLRALQSHTNLGGINLELDDEDCDRDDQTVDDDQNSEFGSNCKDNNDSNVLAASLFVENDPLNEADRESEVSELLRLLW